MSISWHYYSQLRRHRVGENHFLTDGAVQLMNYPNAFDFTICFVVLLFRDLSHGVDGQVKRPRFLQTVTVGENIDLIR